MPYEIKFENVPIGTCVESVRGGGTVTVRAIEFVSEEDGDTLVERLEGLGSDILGKLQVEPSIQPNQVQHLLAIIRSDRSATVYVNELKAVGSMQVKRAFKQGEGVFADDIADVHSLEFEGVGIPKDAGIVIIFSVGWRRAMFYDLIPVLPPEYRKEREYDVNMQLAQFYSYLMFQRRFKITDHEWTNLLDGQWFPFISLKDATIKSLLSHARNSWPLDELSEPIANEVRDAAPTMLSRWKAAPAFSEHIPFLEKAVEHYLANDFISATALLYPRIEGLLRSHQKQTDAASPPTQKGLAGSAVKKVESERHASSPLLPAKFGEYLQNVYFAAFDPNSPHIKVSRNSIGHGVASAAECSLKSATVSLLLVDQLCYCFSDGFAKVSAAPKSNYTG